MMDISYFFKENNFVVKENLCITRQRAAFKKKTKKNNVDREN